MGRRYPLHFISTSVHSVSTRVGIAAVSLCILLLLLVLSRVDNDVFRPHIHAQQEKDVASRLQKGGSRGENTLKLKLMHKNFIESPARKGISSLEEEIIDHVRMDEMRVKGFIASLQYAREAYATYDQESIAPMAAPSSGVDPTPTSSPDPPSPANPPDLFSAPSPDNQVGVEEFQARVSSGALLPSHVGQYFAEFSIGTPPQQFLFITDTGSDLIWAPCSFCKGCQSNVAASKSEATFFPETSSTFKAITCSSQECDLVPPPVGAVCTERSPTSCTYEYVYSDLSQTTGIFAYDTITMMSNSGKNVEIKNVALGCGTNNTGRSITHVGGVIGLGQGPISFSSQVGYLYGNKFSYCFTTFFRRKSSSFLVFGDDPNGKELKSPLQYTPLLLNPLFETFYYVGIKAVSVDKRVLPLPPSVWELDRHGNGGAIIDSGTTLTFFLQPAYAAIVEAFKAAISYPIAAPTAGVELCYNVSGITNPVLPKFAITFEDNAVYRPPSNNYFLSPIDDLRCLGFLGSSGLTILGNLMQQNFFVEYDRSKNRLGFARAHCSVQ